MRGPGQQAGFTLLEALVALAVFGFVTVGAMTLYASNQDAYRRGQTQAESQQNARVALQSVARELRVAGYDPSGVVATLTSPTPIQVANANGLTFVADVTQDGVLDQVSYQLQGGRLVRSISSWDGTAFPTPVPGELASGLSELTLTYFDGTIPVNANLPSPVTTSSLADIRRIRLGLVASDSAIGAQKSFPLFVDIRLRN